MKYEDIPVPTGAETVDPTMLMMGAGIAVAVVLVALSAPRLFTACTVLGVVVGALLIG